MKWEEMSPLILSFPLSAANLMSMNIGCVTELREMFIEPDKEDLLKQWGVRYLEINLHHSKKLCETAHVPYRKRMRIFRTENKVASQLSKEILKGLGVSPTQEIP